MPLPSYYDKYWYTRNEVQPDMIISTTLGEYGIDVTNCKACQMHHKHVEALSDSDGSYFICPVTKKEVSIG